MVAGGRGRHARVRGPNWTPDWLDPRPAVGDLGCRSFYNGTAWFLPFVGAYNKAKDRLR